MFYNTALFYNLTPLHSLIKVLPIQLLQQPIINIICMIKCIASRMVVINMAGNGKTHL